MKPLASIILPPLTAIYSVVTRAHATAYRRKWLSVSKLPVPVISVGNLTTGGTGKTPLVEWVCRTVARETGKRPCVLTRGYRRANPRTQVLVSDGNQVLANFRESGDEPYLLARNLSGIAAVISNPDRLAAGKWAIENLGSDVFVLDDGFQHLALARDLDIVTVDATNPWGGGSLLPYGRLREPRAGLSRAGCVVITRADQVQDTTSITESIKQLAEAIPVFNSRMEISGIRRLDGANSNKESLLAQPIAAFCGVGNPQSFFDQLRREGYNLIFTRAFSDHHDYTKADLTRLVKDAQASGASDLITTAKDALKFTSLELELPCHVLEIRISIAEDERLVEMIRNSCG